MTLYASHDHRPGHAIADPECPTGGHRFTGRDGDVWAVSCAVCEPKLSKQKGNWSDDPNDEALLTRAERLAIERDTKAGLATTAELAKAMSAVAAQQVAEQKAQAARAPKRRPAAV